MLVATDVYRPAAVDQLVTLGQQIDVPVFEMGTEANPVDIARQGVEQARADGVDTVIVDTAGRLQIDPKMMAELADIKAAIDPDEVLLVVDAMTGQEAANLTRTFHDEIGITGAILTKMDGDSRGGRPCRCGKFRANRSNLSGWAKRSKPYNPSTPTAWPRAFWAWEMCSPWWKRPRKP
jgi:signal recognition particle subunit SRP54